MRWEPRPHYHCNRNHTSERMVEGEHPRSQLELPGHDNRSNRTAGAARTARRSCSASQPAEPPACPPTLSYRPNPFLERRLRPPPLPSQRPSLFQRARDWTAFVVSLTSLVTAMIALRNTLTGPRPFLAQMTGDAITILRSDQFLVGSTASPGITLRDETGKKDDFPLILVQPTISNRAPPPNSVGVRAIEGDLAFLRAGRTLFRANYNWYRWTTSSIAYDDEAKVDRLVFENAVQTAPFDLAGGGSWSKEVLLIPRDTWA